MGFFAGAFCLLRRSCLLIAVLLPAGAFMGGASAFAATIADWEMNEPAGARTMHDSSGSGLSGTIGSAVVTGVVSAGATGYQWLSGDRWGTAHPERLITVDSASLNPGTADFTVIVRFHTASRGDQNIIQKGQAHTIGGMWKIPLFGGRVGCNFLGVEHRSAVWSREIVADNKWHTVRCDRRRTGVTLTLDGSAPKTNSNWTGSISNTWPLSIGGKPKCDGGVTVGCDYYVGLLDRVVVARPQCHGVAATMTGTSAADELVGTPGRDVIVAYGGSDQIWGGGGGDLICAGSGADQVHGGARRDRIYGQGGNDVLEGNGGNDVLWGGRGFDTGRGGRGSDTCHSIERASSC
jgi:Ca2+-binding RTX toxin-like protein